MPVLKAVTGHTRCANVMRYLTRKNRALAADYLNLDAPLAGLERGMPAYGGFDWASEMDRTRARHGNDRPWRGKRARTYKHYIISPDPADRIGLEQLRELALSWAREHFPDHEVAIVYHDDNAGGIPHAHLVVNNTDLVTGRRLQVPDPKALNRSLQRMAAERGLRAFDNVERAGAAPAGARLAGRTPPRTLQKVHRGRAESELEAGGRYSWVADIRARVDVARAVVATEGEFRSLLAGMGVTVADNSPKARRPDWLYALADEPSRRVSGEKLGLLYGREAMRRRFAYSPSRMAEADRETVAGIARAAIEVGDLAELRALADAVALVDRLGARSVEDLDRAIALGSAKAGDPALETARSSGILPAKSPRRPRRNGGGADAGGQPGAPAPPAPSGPRGPARPRGPSRKPGERQREGALMLITMHYEDGVEVFDTSERVDPAAYRGNALTNWSVRLEDARLGDGFGGKRLWLDLYAHDLPAEGRGSSPRGLPVASRRDVASFLLADEEDTPRLLMVAVAGEVALVRIGGELVNAARLSHAAGLAAAYIPQAVATRAYLEAAIGEDVEGDPVEALSAMMGFTPEAYARAEAAQARAGR